MVHAIRSRLPPSDAEDQVQEVFLIAWKKLSQLDDAAVFGSWLSAIARNRATYCWRRRCPTEPLEEALADEHHADGSEVTEANNVLNAIHTLPEAYRETLVMRLCEGMTGPEIAEVTLPRAGIGAHQSASWHEAAAGKARHRNQGGRL